MGCSILDRYGDCGTVRAVTLAGRSCSFDRQDSSAERTRLARVQRAESGHRVARRPPNKQNCHVPTGLEGDLR
jgi:hypothetical protein